MKSELTHMVSEADAPCLFSPPDVHFTRVVHDPQGRIMVTILFTDIVDSTRHVEALGDREWSNLLERHHAVVRRQLACYGGCEIEVPGDGFLAIFDTATGAIQCARAIRAALRPTGLTIRAGLHAGECELASGRIRGIAVHIAARIVRTAQAGQILVSSTAKELASGSGLAFSAGVAHVLKGLSSSWQLFELSDQRSEAKHYQLAKTPKPATLRQVLN